MEHPNCRGGWEPVLAPFMVEPERPERLAGGGDSGMLQQASLGAEHAVDGAAKHGLDGRVCIRAGGSVSAGLVEGRSMGLICAM